MRRREFIGVSGGARALPFGVRAQERVRRLAVLMSNVEGDVEQKARISVFLGNPRRRPVRSKAATFASIIASAPPTRPAFGSARRNWQALPLT